MELNENQSALILTESEDGEVSVDVASANIDGLSGMLCQAIAQKIMQDELFQEELMNMIGEWLKLHEDICFWPHNPDFQVRHQRYDFGPHVDEQRIADEPDSVDLQPKFFAGIDPHPFGLLVIIVHIVAIPDMNYSFPGFSRKSLSPPDYCITCVLFAEISFKCRL